MLNAETGWGLTSKVFVVLSLHPKVVVEISLTVNAPTVEYECEGELAVDVAASPKFQRKVDAPVDVFEKTKLFPLKHWLLLLMLNAATGCALTSKVFVVLSLQP